MVTADSELSRAEDSPTALLIPHQLFFMPPFSFKAFVQPSILSDSFISPTLPAYFLLSLSLSLHLHAPTESDSQRVHQMYNTGSSCSTSTQKTQTNALKNSHGFNDLCPFVFVCLWGKTAKGGEVEVEKKAGWRAGHYSD